jgi:hypothetical protein
MRKATAASSCLCVCLSVRIVCLSVRIDCLSVRIDCIATNWTDLSQILYCFVLLIVSTSPLLVKIGQQRQILYVRVHVDVWRLRPLIREILC